MSPHGVQSLVLLSALSVTPAATAQVDSWTTRAAMSSARVFHATCAAGGKIYVFGGQREGGGAAMRSVEEYDPASDSWRSRASLPSARMGMTASAANGRCYLIGGTDAPLNPGLRRVDEYDAASNTWRRRADMPTGRVAGAAAVMNGRIFVSGGWATGAPQSAAVESLEIYDPVANAWTSGAAMPTPRAVLAAATAGEAIYFIGGGSASLGTLDTSVVESYDPLADSWTSRSDLPTPRGTLTAATVNGLIHAIGGGFDVGQLANVEAYDPVTDTWSARNPMPTARWGVSSGVRNGTIFVLGGSTELGVGHNSLTNNEAYTAKAFEINAGLNEAWFNPATDGQGFFIIVYPDISLMFLAWFTYETDQAMAQATVRNQALNPMERLDALIGDDSHRWLTAFGPYAGDTGLLEIEISRGGVFDRGIPVPEREADGTMEVKFKDCTQGTVIYHIESLDLQGEVPIQRLANSNVALCEALAYP